MPIASEFVFPFEHQQKVSLHHPTIASQGLSKREYFAVVCLQGILSNPQTDLSQLVTPDQREALIQTCQVLADELILSMTQPEAYLEASLPESPVNEY